MDGFKLNDVSDVYVGDVLAKQVYIGSSKIWDYKTSPVYTAPTIKTSLVYNGSAQELLNAGSTSHGIIQYSSDGSTWSATIPTSTNASNSITVYWRLVGDSRHTDIASTTLTTSIAKAPQPAPIVTGATTTYPATATATASGGGGQGSLEWESAQSQTSVGSHSTRARWSGNSNYNASPWSNSVTVQMNKAAGSVTKAPVNTNYTYNGTARAVASAGSGTGTMYYRLGSSGSFSTTMPTMTNAGSNTLYYYAAASTNYNQSSTGSITVSVQKANQSAPTATGATTTYGSTATATASGGGGQGSIEWSNGNTLTGNAGSSKTTKARWSGNSNYNASPWSNEVTLSITKIGQPAPTATGATVNYPATATATASGGGGYGSIEWSNGNTQTDVGITKKTKARWSGDGNHYASSWSNEVTLSVISVDGRRKVDNYEVVDLGLTNGLLFATCNLGTNTETGYGNYYMYGKGSQTYNKSDSPYTGTENPLSSSVDTARQVMGVGWRMPTKDELQDLINKTNFSWTTINGVKGGKFISKTNSKAYLFIPAAGFYVNGNINATDNVGTIWSSTPNNSTTSISLFISSTAASTYQQMRTYGRAVRGVHVKV